MTVQLIELIKGVIFCDLSEALLLQPHLLNFPQVLPELILINRQLVHTLPDIHRIHEVRHVEVVMLQNLLHASFLAQSCLSGSQQLLDQITRGWAVDGLQLSWGNAFCHSLFDGGVIYSPISEWWFTDQ